MLRRFTDITLRSSIIIIFTMMLFAEFYIPLVRTLKFLKICLKNELLLFN